MQRPNAPHWSQCIFQNNRNLEACNFSQWTLERQQNTVRYSCQQSYLLSLHLIHLMLMSPVTSFPAPFQFDPYSLPTSPPSSHANSISDTHAERPSENTITFPHKKVSSGRPGQHGLPANLRFTQVIRWLRLSSRKHFISKMHFNQHLLNWIVSTWIFFFISMSCSPANSNLA